MTMNPKVTFIVPCYNLGHLLSACVESILAQTCEDYEVLIMDDCSPDNTPEIAQALEKRDPRVKHIRNTPNLGHLANYNKAINLARGAYIWLISADDYLRTPYVLSRFVELMDRHSNVGYVFCPTMRVDESTETGIMTFTAPQSKDTIFRGHEFLLRHLLEADCVPAPAAMARKKCYTELSMFPLDLPYSGDWYLWSLFALYSDVGYFAEPMVCRRFHGGNISKVFYRDAVKVFFANNLAVPIRIRDKAEQEGHLNIVERCKLSIATVSAQHMIPPKPEDPVQAHMSPEDLDEFLRGRVGTPKAEKEIRSLVFSQIGDHFFEQRDFAQSRVYYQLAVNEDRKLGALWLKYALGRLGTPGLVVREALSAVKQRFKKAP